MDVSAILYSLVGYIIQLSETMKGKLYGVSVGPGSPDLMTLRSKRILEGCDVIGYPVKRSGERSTALSITESVIRLEGRDVREFVFSMDPDDSVRREHEGVAITELISILEKGMDVALIALGDVGVYSTYMYVDRAIRDAGFETEIVPGVNSFSHGASLAGVPLMLGDEGFCVIPMAKGDESRLEMALDSFENIVVMKAFKSIRRIAELMDAHGIPRECAFVMSNVGMDDEYIGLMDTDRDYGYFTTVLIKKESMR